MTDKPQTTDPVRQRLLKAALDSFLTDEYKNVTTRLIAEKADANISMIRYYFGNKAGLYEEMIRETISPLLDELNGPMFSTVDGWGGLLRRYYETMLTHSDFPKLILKVLALNHGPGKRFIHQLIERGRSRGKQRISEMKEKGEMASSVDAEVFRMVFVSLAMTPMLLKEIFEEQWGYAMDPEFLQKLADFSGSLLTMAVRPTSGDREEASIGAMDL